MPANSEFEAAAEQVAFLRDNPKRSGVFLDYDGVIAPIVLDPVKAVPLPGMVDAINAVAGKFGVVAIVSGRELASLRERVALAPQIRLCGLYGLQRLRNGRVVEEASATKWRAVVAEGATTADAQLPKGVRVERKGMSFVLHYRGLSEYAGVAEEWAARFAASSGLDAQSGRASVEIGPFHDSDKGSVVRDLGEGLSAACFVGDDVGDLSAFQALDELSSTSNIKVAKVVVTSDETPASLLSIANVRVNGPEEVLQMLRFLAS